MVNAAIPFSDISLKSFPFLIKPNSAVPGNCSLKALKAPSARYCSLQSWGHHVSPTFMQNGRLKGNLNFRIISERVIRGFFLCLGLPTTAAFLPPIRNWNTKKLIVCWSKPEMPLYTMAVHIFVRYLSEKKSIILKAISLFGKSLNSRRSCFKSSFCWFRSLLHELWISWSRFAIASDLSLSFTTKRSLKIFKIASRQEFSFCKSQMVQSSASAFPRNYFSWIHSHNITTRFIYSAHCLNGGQCKYSLIVNWIGARFSNISIWGID